MSFLALFFMLISVLNVALAENKAYDPFLPGDYPVNYTSILGPLTLFLDTNIDVFAPNAPGNFPVLYFFSGLAAIIPNIAYSDLLSMIASHGIVVVGVWKLDSPVNSFNASWMDATITFVEKRLENNLHNNGFDADLHIDYLNSFMSGHSAGAHIPVAELQQNCRNFKGLMLLNPVDGADPFGILPITVITPGEPVNFTIPTLQVVVGLDNVVGPTTVACAPDNLAGYRFFDAMNGPTWYVNATAYGHGDCLDDVFISILEFSQFCVTLPEPPKELYRNFLSGTYVSFIFGIIDPVDSCYLLDNLEMSGLAGVETVNDFKSNGWDRCAPTQCTMNVY